MEFASLRRPTTAAADDVETGRLRRYPDLPSPPHRDANASPVDGLLARRREELLWELNKARTRQDMILRELAETEHALGFTAAGHNPAPTLPSSQDYWRRRTSSVPPLEEAPPRPPRQSTEHAPCGCRAPAAARVPPVYPYVEWSPSPSQLLQPRPASDTGKQQDGRSSGARTHPFDGYVELCRSPNKRNLLEDASLPSAANAGARLLFRGEVTPGHRDAVAGECKAGVEDGHGMHLMFKSENQNSGQRKTAETTPVDQINGPMLQSGRYRLAVQERVAFDQQKGREFREPTPEKPRLSNGTEQKLECRSSGAHAFNGYVERCLSPSKRALMEETLVSEVAKVGISPMRSVLPFGKEAPSGHQWAFGGEPKADAKDGHGMQVQPLGEIRNQSSVQRKAVESTMEGQTDKFARPPGQHRPAGLENAAYNEQKKVEFSESTHERTSAGVKRKLNATTSLVKKQKPLWKYSCTICHVNTRTQSHLEEHLAGKLHQSNITALQSSVNGAAEPRTKATPVWKRINDAAGSSESQKGGKPHLKSFPHRRDSGPAKAADWKSAFYCKLCDVQCNSEKMLDSHLGGKKHRERLEGSD